MTRTLLPEVEEHFSRRFKEYASYPQLNLIDAEWTRTKKVLEVGCGARFSFTIALEKYGVDITTKLLKELRRKNTDINLIRADVRYLPFKSHAFDIVVAVFLLHHLVGETATVSRRNIYKSLCEMARIIDKQGCLLILEHISDNMLFSSFFFYVTRVFAKLDIAFEYLDIHDKVVTYYLDEKKFKRMIKQIGLTLQILSSERWQFRKICLGHDKLFLLKF